MGWVVPQILTLNLLQPDRDKLYSAVLNGSGLHPPGNSCPCLTDYTNKSSMDSFTCVCTKSMIRPLISIPVGDLPHKGCPVSKAPGTVVLDRDQDNGENRDLILADNCFSASAADI